MDDRRLVKVSKYLSKHLRHGHPVVLAVDTAAMAADGHRFYVSANGVWLVGRVPPQYLRVATD